MHSLSESQRIRYQRHLSLSELGEEGQLQLFRGRVLIVGAGGLGSPVALYLAAAGVGTIGLADGDVVDLSNLQRQILHTTADVGRPKVVSAKEKLLLGNPETVVHTYPEFLTLSRLECLAAQYDVVVDATDSSAAKLFINTACVNTGKPLVHGAIFQFAGQAMTVLPKRSACYACVNRAKEGDAPASLVAGPLGPVPGIIGSIQAAEVLKLLIGLNTEELLVNRLLIMDAKSMDFRTLLVRKRPDCPVCSL